MDELDTPLPATTVRATSEVWQVRLVRSCCPGRFYGHIVVAAAALLMLAAAPGYSFFQSTLTPIVEKEAAQGEKGAAAQVSVAWTIALLVSASLQPFIGRWLDDYGSQAVLSWIIPGFLIGCAFLALGDTVVEVGIAYSFLRACGPEGLEVTARVTVNKWFVRHRGNANALLNIVDGVLPLVPAVFIFAVDGMGRRDAMAAWGLGCLLPLTMAALFLLKTPEACGLQPDGEAEVLIGLCLDDLPSEHDLLRSYGDDDDILEDPDGDNEEVPLPLLVPSLAEPPLPGAVGSHESTGQGEAGRAALVVGRDLTLEEAAQGFALWVFVFAAASTAFLWTGVNFHLTGIVAELVAAGGDSDHPSPQPMGSGAVNGSGSGSVEALRRAGMSRVEAAADDSLVYSCIGFIVPAVGALGAYGFDHLPGGPRRARLIAVSPAAAVLVAGFGAVATSGTWPASKGLLVGFGSVLGFGYGCHVAVLYTTVSLAFGKTAFGSIFTVINTGVTLASAFGPLANGLVKYATGRYHEYFLFTGLVSLVAFFLCIYTPLPNCGSEEDELLLSAASRQDACGAGEEPPNETTALVSNSHQSGRATYRAVAQYT